MILQDGVMALIWEVENPGSPPHCSTDYLSIYYIRISSYSNYYHIKHNFQVKHWISCFIEMADVQFSFNLSTNASLSYMNFWDIKSWSQNSLLLMDLPAD